MDFNNYDEFGNFIGEIEQEDIPTNSIDIPTNSFDIPTNSFDDNDIPTNDVDVVMSVPSSQIILHEDKVYYPSSSQVYGNDVHLLLQQEDSQPLTEPIIKPVKVNHHHIPQDNLPQTIYNKEYLLDLSNFPHLQRHVALVGHQSHGKSTLVDYLIHQTHFLNFNLDKMSRYTDVQLLERDRKMSIKSMPMSLVLPDIKGKSHLINLLDTPGHVNFLDEVTTSLRIADGIILVVDVVEGVMLNTLQSIKQAVLQNLPIILVVNKLDRLILELKLPPLDAYFKIKHVIEQVNGLLLQFKGNEDFRVSPELNNVLFSSGQFDFSFSLKSFAKKYADSHPGFDYIAFGKRLWGDVFYNEESRTFQKNSEGGKRTFVHFILEPLYKLFSCTISSDLNSLKRTLARLDIHLKDSQLEMDVKPLLSLILSSFFGNSSGLVDMIVQHIPDPVSNASKKIEEIYTGDSHSKFTKAMKECNPNGPLMINIVKSYASSDGKRFSCLGRIFSGTVRLGQKVRILGESYSIQDEEDSIVETVSNLSIFESRYEIKTKALSAGSLCFIDGVDGIIVKTATITDDDGNDDDPVCIFKPLSFPTESVVKISIEPVNPIELPKMLDGLRKINKTYPLVKTRVEESGEHVIIGTGEIYLDCVMHDLRRIFAEVEIKVSDPIVKFSETVVETSSFKCFAETPNKKNKLTMISEPLEKGIAEDIESGKINISMPSRKLAQHFTEKYDWDILASRNIWTFGPEDNGGNMLINDTISGEVDKKLLDSIKDSVKQGFKWATREGPLCDEPIRNCKFRLIDASIAQEQVYRGSGQIIPTSRRVCYSSFLTATPRLMEPVYYVEIQAPQDCVAAVYGVLARRRGHATQEQPKPGTPLDMIHGYIPVIDSYGFETDLKTHTQGQASVSMLFDHWQIVPGDPLDKSIVLRPLEPSPAQHLARDFMLKTRRRKGLTEDVGIERFFDDQSIVDLIRTGGILV